MCKAVRRLFASWDPPGGIDLASLNPSEQLPLSESKLAPPRLHPARIGRARIHERLDAGSAVPLTLVAAPAGYGKTSAVCEWAARSAGPVAWVTLDVGDNDPARLWRYVANALNRIRDGIGRTAIQRLTITGMPVEAALDEIIAGLGAFEREIALVLDDFHVVTDSRSLASVDYLLARLPANARVVMVTRSDPALEIVVRRRAYSAVAELRADELAFTRGEVQEFLVSRGLQALEPPDGDVLYDRTEGWPAALVLAALWLAGVADVPRAVRDFGASQQFVADFLSNEVLTSMDDDARSLLFHASVLGRFTPRLCDAVLGRGDSAARLTALAHNNLLLTRLDGRDWFRLHPLFAEFATLRLRDQHRGAPEAIHRQAAEWLWSEGLPVEAIEHAAAAGEEQMVAEILEEYHLQLIRTGGCQTLLRWAGELSDGTLVSFPQVAAASATAASILGGRALERRRLLQLVDRARSRDPESFDGYTEATAEMVRAAAIDTDVALAVASGARAVELGRDGRDPVLVAALAAHARALYFSGDLAGAWKAALGAVEHPDAENRPPGHILARSTLALVAAEQGRIDAARVHAEKAKSIVRTTYASRSWIGANASVAVGAVLMAEGQLTPADREFVIAEQFFRDEVATVHEAWLLVVLAGIRVRRGRLTEAESLLRRAADAMAELTDPGRVSALAAEVADELQGLQHRAIAGEIAQAPSGAELTVLRLLPSDRSAREIGEELFLSGNTVRTHIRMIYRKLGVNSRAEAVARATALGLLEQPRSPR